MRITRDPVATDAVTSAKHTTDMPAELSERISMLRLPLIVGVVLLHAYDPVIGRSTQLHYTGGIKFLVNYISEGLGTLSVPLFFLLGGYLFFHGVQPSIAWFRRKILSRSKTLLIPLLFWNLVCLALTAVAQANPATAAYFSGRSAPVASFRALDYLNAIAGVTSHPIAFQFWFIRDLIVLVVLSPVIYLLLTTVPGLLLVILVARWFSSSTTWTIPFLSREAALFFCIGSLLAMRRVDLRNLDKWTAIALAYVPLSILDALLKESGMSNLIHKTAELFGIALVFCATRYLSKSLTVKQWLIALSPASFFVFASHEPLLAVVRKLSYAFWAPPNAFKLVVLYFADPLFVISFCTAMYFACLRAIPTFTSIITGGRVGTLRGKNASEARRLHGRLSIELGT